MMFNDVCKVTCVDNGKTMTGEIMAFKPGQFLTVSIDRRVKLTLKFNKYVYEGNMGNLTFVSHGPD